MKKGIVSSSNKAFFRIDDNTESPLIEKSKENKALSIWQEILQKFGFNPDNQGLKLEHLFDLVKAIFEKRMNCKLNVSFDVKYIASIDGESPVKHDDSSRVFASNDIVYIDELMVSVLLEYIATTYIWSRYGDEAFSFCFPYELNTLNYCCRQGYLNSDKNKTELLNAIKDFCDDVALEFITDLYWSMLAFAFCHELAHIYLGHVRKSEEKPGEELRQDEIKADALGYDIYLSIIEGITGGIESPFLACFHDYLYAAPMILFLFYQDLYFMEYWLFGETVISDDHPTSDERIKRLLEISEDEKYHFDTLEGNIVLNNYWDTSERFRLELFYKLKNGKLGHVAQKGKIPLDNTISYKEAIDYDNQMRDEMKEMAIQHGLDPNKMVGLYDIATRVETHDQSSLMHFVWSKQNSLFSTKPYNVIFRLRASLTAVIDNGLSLIVAGNKTETIICVLRILLAIMKTSTVKITEDQAKVLQECHSHKAYMIPIDEETLLKKTGVPQKTIDELCELKCIELKDGKVWLYEEIWL